MERGKTQIDVTPLPGTRKGYGKERDSYLGDLHVCPKSYSDDIVTVRQNTADVPLTSQAERSRVQRS